VTDLARILLHEDPTLLARAVEFTSVETGFAAMLIEKDYFCTVPLQHLAGSGAVFKGGTCLAKIHAGFHRLSEDLDFVISVPLGASRTERSRRAALMKQVMASISSDLAGIRLVRPLTGANDSTHYVSLIGYPSVFGGEGTITVEASLREPLLTEAIQGEARTVLLDPARGSPLVPTLRVACLSRDEAVAEKLRAALSRRRAAIRDFFDIDYLVRQVQVDLADPVLVSLVRRKLAVPGNEPIDVSTTRLGDLRSQVDAELKPTLRPQDFADFDLDRAFATVASVAAALA
jgi:predicted nucleotidyltransferase component of viral defense system